MDVFVTYVAFYNSIIPVKLIKGYCSVTFSYINYWLVAHEMLETRGWSHLKLELCFKAVTDPELNHYINGNLYDTSKSVRNNVILIVNQTNNYVNVIYEEDHVYVNIIFISMYLSDFVLNSVNCILPPHDKGHNWQFCQNLVIITNRPRETISTHFNHQMHQFKLLNTKKFSSKSEFHVQANGSLAQ